MSNHDYKGSFKIWTEGNVLFASVTGAWSQDTALRYVKEFKQQVEGFSGNEWAQLVSLDNWILGTPEIEPIITELANWNLARALRCTGFVHSAHSLRHYQIENMLVEEFENYTRKHFETEEEAFEWLKDQGFPVNGINTTD